MTSEEYRSITRIAGDLTVAFALTVCSVSMYFPTFTWEVPIFSWSSWIFLNDFLERQFCSVQPVSVKYSIFWITRCENSRNYIKCVLFAVYRVLSKLFKSLVHLLRYLSKVSSYYECSCWFYCDLRFDNFCSVSIFCYVYMKSANFSRSC